MRKVHVLLSFNERNENVYLEASFFAISETSDVKLSAFLAIPSTVTIHGEF